MAIIGGRLLAFSVMSAFLIDRTRENRNTTMPCILKCILISVANPDPLHLHGSGTTYIPASDPDPDPDPLRFPFPDPLKKALIWIRPHRQTCLRQPCV